MPNGRIRWLINDESGFMVPIALVVGVSAVAVIIGLFVGLFFGDWSVAGFGLMGLAYAAAWWVFWYVVALVRAPFRHARIEKACNEFTRYGPVQGASGLITELPDACWLPDPTRRHHHRFWNGRTWTPDVADDGVRAFDRL